MAIKHAHKEALRFGSASVGVLHILLGILHDETSLPVKALEQAGVNIGFLREKIVEQIPETAEASGEAPNFTEFAGKFWYGRAVSPTPRNLPRSAPSIFSLRSSDFRNPKTKDILKDEGITFGWMEEALRKVAAGENPPDLGTGRGDVQGSQTRAVVSSRFGSRPRRSGSTREIRRSSLNTSFWEFSTTINRLR